MGNDVKRAERAMHNAERLQKATERAFDLYQKTKNEIGCDPTLFNQLSGAKDNAILRLALARSVYLKAIANEATRRSTHPANQ